MNKNNSPFSRFKEMNQTTPTVDKQMNSSFVFNSYQSTPLTNLTSGKRLIGAVASQQEKDKAYIFTHKEEELPIGSIWSVKEGKLIYLITEEIYTIKEVDWHKYLAWLCNASFGDGLWGYFIGPEKSFVDLEIREKAILTSKQQPVLMLPNVSGGSTLGFEDKIVIKGRPWLVQEYDNISTPGITYYSLVPTTLGASAFDEHEGQDTFIVKKEEVIINPINPPTTTGGERGVTYINADEEVTLSTTDGYVDISNGAVQIVKRANNKIIFKVPFGLTEEFLVSTKRGNTIISHRYQVRGV